MKIFGDIPIASVRNQVPIVLRGNIAAIFISFNGLVDNSEHFVIKIGHPGLNGVMVRLHSECITGDVFGSLRCDCGNQLEEAIQNFTGEEGGYLIYMRQEGRGIGLYAKFEAYLLQDQGLDTFDANQALAFPADSRDYLPAVQMINALQLSSIRLLTNNPEKVKNLREYGVAVAEPIPTKVYCTAHNIKYLRAKVAVQGHTIDLAQLGE